MSTAPAQAPRAIGGQPAFVFPGQGSQYAGMGRDLSWCSPASLTFVATAGEVTGLPVQEWLMRADAATLADPLAAQLTVLVHSGVLLRELHSRGVRPALVAGHSLGEYTALMAAGVLSEETALRLVSARGAAMSAAARQSPGAMGAVVGIDEDTLRALCAAVGDQVCVANLNSPRQTVVSGAPAQVEQVLAAAREAGAMRAKRLSVGGAYHSPLMAPAQASLAPVLLAASFAAPQLPVVSSLTGALVHDVAAHQLALVGQMTAPVQWRRAFDALRDAGAHHFVEVGPGRALTGLGREMDRSATHASVLDALASSPAHTPRSTS